MRVSLAKLAVVAVGLTSFNMASAAIQFTSRFSEFDIVVADMQFSSATVHYATTFEVAGNPGDTFNNAQVPLKALATNSSISTTGGASVNNLLTTPGVLTTFNLASDGTLGTITGASDVPIGASFAQSFLVHGTQNGLNVLNFASGDGLNVFGLMAPNSHYDLDVKINGDWTNWGSNSGDILGTALNFAGGWTFDQPFSFDGSETTIHFHNTNYLGNNGPALAFTLFGDPANVPEPGVPALFGVAVAALAATRRRSSR